MNLEPQLKVLMYHYVRDPAHTPLPAIPAMPVSEFVEQLDELPRRWEIASFDSALEFLLGRYRPSRDLVLLTFDDGLRDHYEIVVPELCRRKLQGVFFVITSCLEEGRVAPVHMNHCLMAGLGFHTYRDLFFRELAGFGGQPQQTRPVPAGVASRTYPWDEPAVAEFKWVFNFTLDPELREKVVEKLFVRYFGDEQKYSCQLYLQPAEARDMQSAGMVLGGHSHRHRPLALLSQRELCADLQACRAALDRLLLPQVRWPFCYPYGKRNSYSAAVIQALKSSSFDCAFSSEAGDNTSGAPLYALVRTDCCWRRRATRATERSAHV